MDSEVLEVNFKRFLAHIGTQNRRPLQREPAANVFTRALTGIHVDLFPSLNQVNGDLLSGQADKAGACVTSSRPAEWNGDRV